MPEAVTPVGQRAQIRVLIVEDSPTDAELAARELVRAGLPIVLRIAATREALIEELREFGPDVVITDDSLPTFGGREALQVVQQYAPRIPVVLLTGSLDEETAVEYMKAGAADFVIKDRQARLPSAITGAIERRRLEEQLQQSQKMEAVGRLAGGVAHDFNNLTTVVLGNAELLLNSPELTDPLRQCAQEIRDAAQRSSLLTRQLLAFSRRQVLDSQVINLNTLILNLEGMLRRLIGEAIDIRLSLRADLNNVRADPGQLDQVILNLAVNARDAMPGGGALLLETNNVELDEPFARSELGLPPGSYVRLAVTDSGAGIDPALLDRIFEPFFTTKEVGRGSGLGLSTCYGIIRQSGGHITAYSEVDRGTSFHVYLPRSAEAPVKPAAAAAPAKALGGSETVLIVEDEESVRRLVRRALETSGYQVLEAGDGTAAMAIVDTTPSPIALLITDVVMPQMSGPELVRRLQTRFSALKVLYLSGYSNEALVPTQTGGTEVSFLPKPFSLDALARKVRELLDSPGHPA